MIKKHKNDMQALKKKLKAEESERNKMHKDQLNKIEQDYQNAKKKIEE